MDEVAVVHQMTTVTMMIVTVEGMVEVVVAMTNTMEDMGEVKGMVEEIVTLVVIDITAEEVDEVD